MQLTLKPLRVVILFIGNGAELLRRPSSVEFCITGKRRFNAFFTRDNPSAFIRVISIKQKAANGLYSLIAKQQTLQQLLLRPTLCLIAHGACGKWLHQNRQKLLRTAG